MSVAAFSKVDTSDFKSVIKAYVLEVAIAIHSIIIGIALGTMGEEEIQEIRILMIAYAVH